MQICWSIDNHGITSRQTSQRLNLRTAISAQCDRSPLRFIALDEEDNFLAVIVAHRTLRYKNRGLVGNILARWFIAEESHFDSHVGQDARIKLQK